MDNFSILVASEKDIPQLVKLINSAYRGESAKKGWTHEADLIDSSQRTDEAMLLQTLQKENSTILKYIEDDNKLLGCVYLQKQNARLYLGMLTVSPNIQGKGIGKKLLKAAEEHAKEKGCSSIIMNVISVRKELIQWYERHGYKDNGQRKPFPHDAKFNHSSQVLEFMIMEKIF